jgi:hypothetical protein
MSMFFSQLASFGKFSTGNYTVQDPLGTIIDCIFLFPSYCRFFITLSPALIGKMEGNIIGFTEGNLGNVSTSIWNSQLSNRGTVTDAFPKT